jgi:hypothetical protein
MQSALLFDSNANAIAIAIAIAMAMAKITLLSFTPPTASSGYTYIA